MNEPRTSDSMDRRRFLQHASWGIAGAAFAHPMLLGRTEGAESGRPKVAAVITSFQYREHAHVILENFLEPYLFNGKRTDPGCDVVSFYVDQFPAQDMSRDVAKKYNIPIYPTIREALCLGGKSLAVDAVLAIGEHGQYPKSPKGQVEYPRKRFFDEIVAVYESSGKVAPLFNDKHLSYRWDWAKEMYDTAKRMKIPFLAGSSVPLAERRPMLELPSDARIVEAVSIHGGPVESYDFHGLEVLQSMVEARKGGETGIASIQFLDEDALWKAADDGLWSPELAQAAMKTETGADTPIRELVRSRSLGSQPSHGILVRYRDGLKGLVMTVGHSGTRWNFACRLDGQSDPQACRFHVGPWENRNLFKALSHAIQTMFREKKAPYPVERTLLTTGALDAAMDSKLAGGKSVETPQLAVAYAPIDFKAMREMGATWKIITDAVPQPKGIEPVLVDPDNRR